MKNKLRKLMAGMLVFGILFGIGSHVFAAAYDPIIGYRTGDDGADTAAHIVGLDTSHYAVYGDRLNQAGAPAGYYFGPGFNINATSGTYGINNYRIDLDLSGYNPVDIGDLGDRLDAKVPTARTVNGHALSSNITVTSSDVGLSDVDNTSDINKPISTATQTALDTKGKAYEGTTARANSVEYFGHSTVASGVAVFQLTSDGTSSGTVLFPNGIIQDSVSLTVSDATASYQMSYAFTNSNKTLTVTANKLTTANILSGILGQSAANGAVIKLTVFGY